MLDKIQFNCTKVCIPLPSLTFLNMIDHEYENCEKASDYYCMVNAYMQNYPEISILSQESVRPCSIRSPKIEHMFESNNDEWQLEGYDQTIRTVKNWC